MRLNLILACIIGFGVLASAANTFAEDKPDSVVLPPDTFAVRYDTPPIFVKEVKPTYPVLAKEGGFKAYVEIKAFVDSTGKILRIEHKTDRRNMGFERAAIKSAYESELAPATLKGNPVGVWIKYRITFNPRDGIKRGPINSYNLQWSK